LRLRRLGKKSELSRNHRRERKKGGERKVKHEGPPGEGGLPKEKSPTFGENYLNRWKGKEGNGSHTGEVGGRGGSTGNKAYAF